MISKNLHINNDNKKKTRKEEKEKNTHNPLKSVFNHWHSYAIANAIVIPIWMHRMLMSHFIKLIRSFGSRLIIVTFVFYSCYYHCDEVYGNGMWFAWEISIQVFSSLCKSVESKIEFSLCFSQKAPIPLH